MTAEAKRKINGLVEGKRILGIEEGGGVPELQNLALEVKQSINGHADPMPLASLKAIEEYMSLRLEIWHEPSDPIDEAVKSMCNYAIGLAQQEIDGRGW